MERKTTKQKNHVQNPNETNKTPKQLEIIWREGIDSPESTLNLFCFFEVYLWRKVE